MKVRRGEDEDKEGEKEWREGTEGDTQLEVFYRNQDKRLWVGQVQLVPVQSVKVCACATGVHSMAPVHTTQGETTSTPFPVQPTSVQGGEKSTAQSVPRVCACVN